jgi:hypothetical protein
LEQEANQNTEMDLKKGLDIADNKTSAGKKGDEVSTQRVCKYVNTFDENFLSEIGT